MSQKMTLNLGIARESEKAFMIVYSNHSGAFTTTWLPKSQVELLERKQWGGFYNKYYYSSDSNKPDVTVEKIPVEDYGIFEVPSWLINKIKGFKEGIF
jgi:hypothetical protein